MNLGVTFNPCMVAVPLYIIAFVGYIVNYNNKINIEEGKQEFISKDFIRIVIFSIISLILVINSRITYGIILGLVYLVLTTIKIIQDVDNHIRKLILIWGTIGIFGFIFLIMLLMGPHYRLDRLIASFNPEIDPNGSGYIGMLQKEILENANLIGEANTEVISSDKYLVIEESNYTFIYLLGKAGVLIAGILVLTIVLTSLKMILNSKIVKDKYGKFLIIGLSTLYIIQSVVSVLMNINLGIKTDVKLPFVTYGGIYFIVNILGVAIILSVYRRKDITLYDDINIEKQV